eukprot:g65654.t1
MMHYVLKTNRMMPPWPQGMEVMVLATGCFWGTEKGFWRLPGVYSTAVGYIGGSVDNPTYEQVCSGRTGHTEGTQVVWDPRKLSVSDLLYRFWDSHDPTQGDRQGNDVGSQYRSGIYCSNADNLAVARASMQAFEKELARKGGFGHITTELQGPDESGRPPKFWYAEEYHQQYLAKPGSRQYCSAQPTGVRVPPFASWPGLSTHLQTLYPPKLSEAFWDAYDGSIRAPNQPVQLESAPKASQVEEDGPAGVVKAALQQHSRVDFLQS